VNQGAGRAAGCDAASLDLARELAELTARRAAEAFGPLVAGVDEVGRGPLAGPVVAAAVILPFGLTLAGELDDSKRLSPAARERLASRIRTHALAWGVGRVSSRHVDRDGIAVATERAMGMAVASLRPRPDVVLVDGLRVPPGLDVPARAVVDGDRLVAAIMAASILAKVARDREMARWDRRFPGYGFAEHRGYGTALHRARLAALGPCAIHRRSFLHEGEGTPRRAHDRGGDGFLAGTSADQTVP